MKVLVEQTIYSVVIRTRRKDAYITSKFFMHVIIRDKNYLHSKTKLNLPS